MSTLRTANTLRDRHDPRDARRPIDIDLFKDNDRLKIARRRFLVNYDPGDVQDLNERFIEILEAIRSDTLKQNKLLPLPNNSKHLQKLRNVGTEAYALFPQEVFAYLSELEQRNLDRGLSLDFTFPAGMALLWEMIYTGDLFGPVDISKFWGFHYPIGHLYWGSDVEDRIRLHKGAFALAHSGLAASIAELNQIEQYLDRLNTHMPVEVVLHRLEDVIPHDDLCDRSVLLRFGDTDFAYGMVHFACHCVNPGQAGASRAYLDLKIHQQKIQLSVGRFHALAHRNKGFQNRPLVFLNACESATPLHFLQSLKLPTALLEFGAGGVVATACTLPDNFASAFASKFYQCLFDKPLHNSYAYIGEALLETRKHFMTEYNNPLGLAYGMYSLSNQWLQLR